jgi:hypothetical protein
MMGSLLYILASSYMLHSFGEDILDGLTEDSTVKME